MLTFGHRLLVYWRMDDTVGLAWDCGAITTGPVTVPLVLSLGIGVASSQGKGGPSDKLSGFGIVTLASLFPVFAVQMLPILIDYIQVTAQIGENLLAGPDTLPLAWFEHSPFAEVTSPPLPSTSCHTGED